MSAEIAADNSAKNEFIKRNACLTTVPAKVMVIADLQLLDLSHNEIEVVPKGLFPNIDKLKTLQLSHNVIKALPDDISALKLLETLAVSHNCLAVLPDGLFALAAVRDIDASCNHIDYIPDAIGNMEGLHVLSLAGNRLRAIPSDIGWLGLKQLNISDNPDLHIPPHVLQCGFKAVMSYLQVIGEQHQLVERHMTAFTHRLTELQEKHGLQLGSMENAVATRLKVAQRLGIFSCSHCRLAALPAGLEAQEALSGVQVADLSHNKLRTLPLQLLQGMDRLLVASLSCNSLKTLPESLGLSTIAVLDLSFNKLVSLPADMGQQLPAMQQLYLANNYLTSLPESLAAAPLQDVFLSENAFEVVPQAYGIHVTIFSILSAKAVPAVLQVLGRCKGLAKLSLAACQLSVLGDELQGLQELRFLDISFNQLKVLPTSMSSLVQLAAFNLGFNPLGTFPEVLCRLTNLKELNLDNTGISSFPVDVGELRLLQGLQAEGCPLACPFASMYAKDPLLLVKLHDTQLQSLDLSDLGLEEVPQQLLRLTALTSLSLFKNAIKDLPVGLGELRQLQSLTLRANPLRQPYLKIMDAKGELPLLSFLRAEGSGGCLDLEGCGFESLPREVWEPPGRTQLVSLQLTNNRLRDLPQELSCLVGLTQLVLDNNLLRHLPNVVMSLPALAVLMASGNSITYLPDALGGMRQLQALILHSNQLMQLPDSLTGLTNLRALGLTSNRLWQLPQGMAACTSLRLLDCSHNLLNKLPGGMGGLVKLRSLKLTHNKMSWVPVDELQQLQGLLELHLAANQFTVDVEMNANELVAVQELLAAIADSPAGHPPPQQHAYSRNPSSLYSNVNSYSPSAAESTRSYSPARSRLMDQPGSMNSTAGTARKGSTGVTLGKDGKQQLEGPEGNPVHHHQHLGVTWNDEHSSPASNRSSISDLSGSGAAAAAATGGGSSGDGAAQAASSNHGVKHTSDGMPYQAGSRFSLDGGMRRSADGTCSKSEERPRRSADGSGPRQSVRFTDDPVIDEQPAGSSVAAGDSNNGIAGAAAGAANEAAAAALAAAAAAQQQQHSVADGHAVDVAAAAAAAAAGGDFDGQRSSSDGGMPKASVHVPDGGSVAGGTGSHMSTSSMQQPPQEPQQVTVPGQGPPHRAQVPVPVATQEACSSAGSLPAAEAKPATSTNNGRHGKDVAVAHGHAQLEAKLQNRADGQQQEQQQHDAGFRLAAIHGQWPQPVGTAGSSAWQPSSWDKLPLMDIPRIIKALATPPPPPAAAGSAAGPAAGDDGAAAVRRPQTKSRFKRVIEQTNKAMAFLEMSMAAAAATAAATEEQSSKPES